MNEVFIAMLPLRSSRSLSRRWRIRRTSTREFNAPAELPPLPPTQVRHPAFSPISRPLLQTTNVYSSTLKAIGNTALIKLKKASELTGCNIYGKAEYANPGGSVKDRAALWIIKEAEDSGLLVPGSGLIVEGSAGNTAIGLTLIGNARGYKTLITIADTQSLEKRQTLRVSGAALIEVPAVPFKDPNNYVHVAARLAAELAQSPEWNGRVLYANQWDNLANRRSHFESTGPEIWEQTQHKIDAFCCATGTGGTLSGVGSFLRTKATAAHPILTMLTDPKGAGLYRWFTQGEMRAEGSSISEGIGQNRITGNMADFIPNDCFEVDDADAMAACFDLLELEGLGVGSSTAINIAGAIQVAKKLGKGKTIVTILCDRGDRYASKIYNPAFLKSRGLAVPRWLDERQAFTDSLKSTVDRAMHQPES